MLLNVLLLIAGIIAALLVLPYVLGAVMRYVVAPILQIGRTMPIEPAFAPIDLSAPGVPDAMIDAARQLGPCGFSAELHQFVADHLPRTKAWESIWRHRGDACAARVLAVRVESPIGGRMEESFVAFETDFTDGSAIITTNMASPSIFAPDPALASVHWRAMQDLTTLYRLHRARVSLHGASRVAKPFDDPLEYARDGGRRTMRRQVEAGYFVQDEPAGVYRTTLKGAMLVYRLSWPWRDITVSRWRRALRDELAACDMGRPEDYTLQALLSDSARS